MSVAGHQTLRVRITGKVTATPASIKTGDRAAGPETTSSGWTITRPLDLIFG
jgi:hypothetical protein